MIAADLSMFVAGVRYASEQVDRMVERLTIYTSPRDRALGLSGWLRGGYARVGGLPMRKLPQRLLDQAARKPWLHIVENSTSTYDPLGHSYFRTNPSASSDLILLLRYGIEPGEENGRPLDKTDGGPVWHIRNGYPFGVPLPAEPHIEREEREDP